MRPNVAKNLEGASSTRRDGRRSDRSRGAHAELDALERTGGPPAIDVLEVRDRARRVAAAVEPLAPPDRSALVVVVAGRAIGVAEERLRVGLEQLDPGLLRRLGLL